MRLFVALDVPGPLLQRISTIRTELEPLTTGIRWIRPESMHLTLRFLGDVAPERTGVVERGLGSAQTAPFKVSVSGVGFFPNDRAPRVLWAGVSSDGLRRLAASIERQAVALGFPPARPKFTPHLTLARSRGSESVSRTVVQAAERFRNQEFGSFTVDRFYLYESRLKPSGAAYFKVCAYPLKPANPGVWR